MKIFADQIEGNIKGPPTLLAAGVAFLGTIEPPSSSETEPGLCMLQKSRSIRVSTLLVNWLG